MSAVNIRALQEYFGVQESKNAGNSPLLNWILKDAFSSEDLNVVRGTRMILVNMMLD
jgi:hypothetical protein